jgi:hypothetical protein
VEVNLKVRKGQVSRLDQYSRQETSLTPPRANGGPLSCTLMDLEGRAREVRDGELRIVPPRTETSAIGLGVTMACVLVCIHP